MVKVMVPEQETPEVREAAEKLKGAYGNVREELKL